MSETHTIQEIQEARKAAIRALADEWVEADLATHSSDEPHVQWAPNDKRDPAHELFVEGREEEQAKADAKNAAAADAAEKQAHEDAKARKAAEKEVEKEAADAKKAEEAETKKASKAKKEDAEKE